MTVAVEPPRTIGPPVAVCDTCDNRRPCHTERDETGDHPICAACVIGLLAEADRYGDTLTINVQIGASVAASAVAS